MGEWHDLARSYADQDAAMPQALVAWSVGEDVDPGTLQFALDIEARMVGEPTDRTHELLDTAIERLTEGFPELST